MLNYAPIRLNYSGLEKRVKFGRFNRYVIWLPFLLFLFVILPNALAHQLGEGYIFLRVLEQHIEGRVELTLSDLDDAVGLDRDKDGKINDQELMANLDMVKSYILGKLKFGVKGIPLPYHFGDHKIVNISSSRFLMIDFVIENPLPISKIEILDIEYTLLFEIGPNQRGLVVLEENTHMGLVKNSERVALILTPKRPHKKLNLATNSLLKEFVIFVGQGIWHIWIGIDHILFIIVLILISVVTRKHRVWQSVSNFGDALINLIKIITLFTVAHSITLCLAALGVVQLSPRIVESAIAASVVIAALNNLFPVFGRRDWLIIFCFGLFHGLGFASVLGHLILNQQSLLAALLGFNIGVEIGQLAIVCISFPIFYMVRKTKFYEPVFIKIGSVSIGVLAALWFIERAFEIDPIIAIF